MGRVASKYREALSSATGLGGSAACKPLPRVPQYVDTFQARRDSGETEERGMNQPSAKEPRQQREER
jgi:hypothetical protein